MKLIIQIPCYNEEQNLEKVIDNLPKKINGIDEIEYMVINDGSTDKTRDIAKGKNVKYIIDISPNKGLANAFMTGIKECLKNGADIIVNIDGDNQYTGKDILKLIQPILDKKADMVIGERQIEKFSPIKRILQRFGSWVIRKISKTKVKDAPSGFRAFSRECAFKLNVSSKFTYTLETIIQAGSNGARIENIKITSTPNTRKSRLFKNTAQYIFKSSIDIIRATYRYKFTKRWKIASALIAILLLVFLGIKFLMPCIFNNKKNEQIKLVAKIKPILKVDGLEFKDLNNNGELDIYEDWRYTSEERAKDLVNKMTLEEKAGMMVINSAFVKKGNDDSDSRLNEESSSSDTKIYMNYVGNTEAVKDLNIRHLITREDNVKPVTIAEWNNELNELAESTRLGIPVLLTSNAKNNLSYLVWADYKNFAYTMYPSPLGIAAAFMGERKVNGESSIIKNFAGTIKQEIKASGIRKGYMYSCDIMTDARWGRNNETFGEDVEVVSKISSELIKELQGENGLNSNGISLTIKHFPGSGARINGYDAHFEEGRYSLYKTENSLENYHLQPFQEAVNSKVSSIMPYYSQPDPQSGIQTYKEKVIKMDGSSYTYNDEFLTKLLRENMKFEGYINTDSGVIDWMYWGEENKTNVEKTAKAINAGVDLISDTYHVEWIIDAVKQNLVSEDRIDEAITRVLKEMFDLGLFENPYVDIEMARNNSTTEEAILEAYRTHQKSVVLLKDVDETLPIKKNAKVYVKEYGTTGRIIPDALVTREYNIEIVKDYNEADYLITYISGQITDEEINDLNLKDVMKNDFENWVQIGDKIKANGGERITIINFNTAYLLNEIEKNSDVLLGGFNTYTCAILDNIVGNCKPVGVLPFTIPASNDVIMIDKNGNCASPNDVPGYDKSKYMENGLNYEFVDSVGNTYKTGFGLHCTEIYLH